MNSPVNHSPYTVTRNFAYINAYDVKYGTEVIKSNVWGESQASQLATLLNDAYHKGIESGRVTTLKGLNHTAALAATGGPFVQIGVKHVGDRTTHIWWGNPIEEAPIYCRVGDLRPEDAHIKDLVPTHPEGRILFEQEGGGDQTEWKVPNLDELLGRATPPKTLAQVCGLSEDALAEHLAAQNAAGGPEAYAMGASPVYPIVPNTQLKFPCWLWRTHGDYWNNWSGHMPVPDDATHYSPDSPLPPINRPTP